MLITISIKNTIRYNPDSIVTVFSKHYLTLAILKRCSVYFLTSFAVANLYGFVHLTDSSFGKIIKLAGEKSPTNKTFSSNLPKWQLTSAKISFLLSKKDLSTALIFEHILVINFISSGVQRLKEIKWLSDIILSFPFP